MVAECRAPVVIADVPDGGPEDDIDLASCTVREYWRSGIGDEGHRFIRKGKPKAEGATVRQFCDWFKEQPIQ